VLLKLHNKLNGIYSSFNQKWSSITKRVEIAIRDTSGNQKPPVCPAQTEKADGGECGLPLPSALECPSLLGGESLPTHSALVSLAARTEQSCKHQCNEHTGSNKAISTRMSRHESWHLTHRMLGWKSSGHSSSLIPCWRNGVLDQLKRFSWNSGNAVWSKRPWAFHLQHNTHCFSRGQ
jgi:hypothetical protein